MKNIIVHNSIRYATISFAGEEDNFYLLSIKDSKGKLMFNQAVVPENKHTTVFVPIMDVSPGIYSLIIRSAKAIKATKIFLGKTIRRKNRPQ